MARDVKDLYIEKTNEEWGYVNFINNLSRGDLNTNLLKSLLLLTEIHLSNGDKNKINRIIDTDFLIEYIMPNDKNIKISDYKNSDFSDDEWNTKYADNVNKIGNLLIVYKQNKTKSSSVFFNDRNEKWENLDLNIYKSENPKIDIHDKSKWRISCIEARTEALIEQIKNFIH